MFQTRGTCYHTGYKPQFHDLPETVLPVIARVRRRLMHPEELKQREQDGLPILPENRRNDNA